MEYIKRNVQQFLSFYSISYLDKHLCTDIQNDSVVLFLMLRVQIKRNRTITMPQHQQKYQNEA